MPKTNQQELITVVAGGTGGHFYPGLAVAKALASDGFRLRFIVRHGDFVAGFLEDEKIPYTCIFAGGFERRLHPKNIISLFLLGWGFFESLGHLLIHRPRLLLVMGGYLSVPPALAALFLGVPVMLHEQNRTAGLANRLISRVAKKVAVSFPLSEANAFRGKEVLTGNPVREVFGRLPLPDLARGKLGLTPSRKTVLVFGGSQGAHHLNQMIVEAFTGLRAQADDLQIIHLTGKKDEQWVQDSYEKLPFRFLVKGFMKEMEVVYGASDLVISRSGAGTISELIATRKPAILIPYPYASERHQHANAGLLVERGAAEMYEESDLSPVILGKAMMKILSSGKHQEMRQRYDSFPVSPLTAAGRIKEEICKLLNLS